MAKVRIDVHTGDRQKGQPVVVVSEPLERVTEYLREDRVDARGPR